MRIRLFLFYNWYIFGIKHKIKSKFVQMRVITALLTIIQVYVITFSEVIPRLSNANNTYK